MQDIALSGNRAADISLGSPQSASITFDGNRIEEVVTEVHNGVLWVRTEGSYSTQLNSTQLGSKIKIVTESLG